MGQSESNDVENNAAEVIPMPRRKLTIEFIVGLFTIISICAAGYLAIGLGGLELGSKDKYTVYAEFDNISGLNYGASVEIAGVQVGDVSKISLDDSVAILTMRIDKKVKLYDEDIVAIRTKGIIGDRYVKISRGSSESTVSPEDTLMETESVVDFEDIIGKIVHSLTDEE